MSLRDTGLLVAVQTHCDGNRGTYGFSKLVLFAGFLDTVVSRIFDALLLTFHSAQKVVKAEVGQCSCDIE